MKRHTLFIIISLVATTVMAQPAKRRVQPTASAAQTTTTPKGTDRASLMFPTSTSMPEDVSWRREIYRQLDLTKGTNAVLYYPVQPIGNQCNLFTYLVRLMLTGRVSAYDYKISGLESFAEKDKVEIGEFLRRYSIYYEEKDGKITVPDADVPSEQVKRYYIKESAYLDQRTGVTRTKVEAICPILLEGGEFGEDMATPRPLFWMKYDDVAPYLSKLPVTSGDLNNVSNMTADDYFTLNRYEGKIYKTTNMQGKVLADYCPTDSDMVREQQRIEQQLVDFEEHLWGHKPAVADSTAADSALVAAGQKAPAQAARKERKPAASLIKPKGSSAKSSNSARSKAAEESSSSGSAEQPRVSARRERR